MKVSENLDIKKRVHGKTQGNIFGKIFSLTELEIGAASAVSNFDDAMEGMLIVLVKLGILPGFWLFT